MYDSRTDRATWDGRYRWVDGQYVWIENYWRYKESHSSSSYKKWAKRAAAKKDRRSNTPRTQFRAYGWGDSNIGWY